MTRRLLWGCLAVALAVSVGPSAQSDTDWTRFGFDVARTSASTVATGITPANIGSLQRQQITLDDSVDASAIYLAASSAPADRAPRCF